MDLPARHRPGFIHPEAPWKGPLLISMALHAILVWTIVAWWQKSYRATPPPPEVIEIEVVSRIAPKAPVEPVAKPVTPPLLQPVSPPPPRPEPKANPTRPQLRPSTVVSTPMSDPPVTPSSQAAAPHRGPEIPQTVSTNGDAKTGEETAVKSEVVPGAMSERAIGPEQDRREAERHAYQKQLRSLIERHKRYPLMARKGRQEGRVTVGFTLDSGGELITANVVHSSGYTLLDRAGLKAVRAVDRYPALPPSLSEDTRFEIDITFAIE